MPMQTWDEMRATTELPRLFDADDLPTTRTGLLSRRLDDASSRLTAAAGAMVRTLDDHLNPDGTLRLSGLRLSLLDLQGQVQQVAEAAGVIVDVAAAVRKDVSLG